MSHQRTRMACVSLYQESRPFLPFQDETVQERFCAILCPRGGSGGCTKWENEIIFLLYGETNKSGR